MEDNYLVIKCFFSGINGNNLDILESCMQESGIKSNFIENIKQTKENYFEKEYAVQNTTKSSMFDEGHTIICISSDINNSNYFNTTELIKKNSLLDKTQNSESFENVLTETSTYKKITYKTIADKINETNKQQFLEKNVQLETKLNKVSDADDHIFSSSKEFFEEKKKVKMF